MVHRHPIKVRFYELDPYNHVNHSAYIQYFEVGRVELLQSIGFGLDAMQEDGSQIVVTELATRFLAPAGPLDRLVVETEVLEVRRASTRWSQRLLRGSEVIASQEIKAAVIDTTGKPIRMLPHLADALRPFMADPA